MDGEAKALRENEDVKEFYLGIAEGRAQSVPRRASTTSGASGGWRSAMSDHYDELETRDPAARERDCSRGCRTSIAHAR